MELIFPYLICAAMLVAFYALMRLCLALSNRLALRSVYKSGVYTKKTMYTVLFARFGAKKLRSELYLPCRGTGGTRYERYEHILVLSGGVAVVSLRTENGAIRNAPGAKTWSFRKRMKSGTVREFEFENPIASSRRLADALSELLSQKNGKRRIPVEPICVFLPKNATFEEPRDQALLTPPDAIRKLTEIDEKPLLSEEERRFVLTVLRRYARSSSYAAAKNMQTHVK